MTLLMFRITDEQILIVTDTLATVDDGQPGFFVSKCLAVPHLGMAIAQTGVAEFGRRWTAKVQESLLVRSMTNLDTHAPGAIRDLWREVTTQPNFADQTATIYHFGRDEDSGMYTGYAYRSTKDFVSERLVSDGFAVKPGPGGPFEPPGNLDQWVDLAVRVRADQDAGPKASRLHIGGSLILTVLQDDVIVTNEIYRFGDHDSMWNDMNAYHFSGRS